MNSSIKDVDLDICVVAKVLFFLFTFMGQYLLYSRSAWFLRKQKHQQHYSNEELKFMLKI